MQQAGVNHVLYMPRVMKVSFKTSVFIYEMNASQSELNPNLKTQIKIYNDDSY